MTRLLSLGMIGSSVVVAIAVLTFAADKHAPAEWPVFRGNAVQNGLAPTRLPDADEALYCLSKDGKNLWKFKIGGPINGSPAVAEGRTFVAGCDSILHVVSADQGKELSQVDLGGQAGASAAVDGSQLYVGTMTN